MDKTMQHSTGGSMSRVLNTEIIIPVIENLVKKLVMNWMIISCVLFVKHMRKKSQRSARKLLRY